MLRLESGTTTPSYHGTILRALRMLSHTSAGRGLKWYYLFFLDFTVIPWGSFFHWFSLCWLFFNPNSLLISLVVFSVPWCSLWFYFRLIHSRAFWSFLCASQHLKGCRPASEGVGCWLCGSKILGAISPSCFCGRLHGWSLCHVFPIFDFWEFIFFFKNYTLKMIFFFFRSLSSFSTGPFIFSLVPSAVV